MYNVLKFGVCFGVAISLAGCSSSEHFMQDDVYNTRTPIMPPGTDLNDVTDYATFVAKKEQTEVPQERTTYVSPRQYYDYFYNTQYVYYGYSPYSPMTGLGYYGYSNFYTPYYNMGYGYGYGSNTFGNPYHYGYSTAYPYGYYPYGGGYPSYYGNTSWYTPVSKPNAGGNMSNAHAGTSAGRMGSSSSGFVHYDNKLIAKPNTNGFSGAGRNTMANPSPVLNTGNNAPGRVSTAGVSPRQSARPVVAGRPSTPTMERTGTYNRSEANPNSGVNNRTINTNSSPRTSSPTMRSGSGGSGGGSISSPSGGGGARSGGRR
jgi:hypothetical protein